MSKNEFVVLKTSSFWIKRLSFDDFLMTTWEQEPDKKGTTNFVPSWTKKVAWAQFRLFLKDGFLDDIIQKRSVCVAWSSRSKRQFFEKMPGGSSYKTRVRGLSSQLKFRTQQSVDKLPILKKILSSSSYTMMPLHEEPRNIPKPAHSEKGATFWKGHILKRAYCEKGTFWKGHIPKRAHSKKGTFQKGYIPKRAHSKKSTFQKGHIPKRAHAIYI